MAVVPSYPSNVRVFIDDEDVTFYIFGVDTLLLTDVFHTFHDINITSFLQSPGRHKLKITADNGAGRVEARISIR